MDRSKIKACPFCGKPATVEIRTLNEKEYYAIGCDNVACRGSAWAGDPDAVRALSRWNERAGDRKPATPKSTGVKALASASGYESLLNAAKRLIEDERFDYFANTNCPKGQEDDGVRLWNDLVLAIHAADPEYDS